MTDDGIPRPPGLFVRVPLWFVDRLRRPIAAAGIDYPSFRALLEVRLLLDTRRSRSRRRGQGTGAFGMGLMATCGMDVLIGLMASSILLALRHSPGVALALVIAIMMLFTTMVLVVDFSPMLLDTTDLDIVGSSPVEDSALYGARVAHMVVYLLLVTASLALFPMLVGCLVYPFFTFFPVFLLSSAMSALWCLSLSFGLFVLAMRIFDLDRLQNALLYVQIGATVVLMGAYLLFSPLMMQRGLPQWVAGHSLVRFLLPPLHYGALLETTLGAASTVNLVLSVCAFSLPLLAFAITIFLAHGHFRSGLAALARGGRSASQKIHRRFPIRDLLVHTESGRAGYDFFTALSHRERQFRLRVYPTLVLAPMLGVYFVVQGVRLTNHALLCAAIYMLAVYVPTIVLQSRFSESFKAAWLILDSPLPRPGKFIGGAMIALLTTILLPVLLVILALVVAVGGLAVLPDALVAFTGTLVLALATILALGRRLPFTLEPPRNPAEGNLGMIFLFMAFTGVVALVHFAARLNPISFYTYFGLLLVGLALEIRALVNFEPAWL